MMLLAAMMALFAAQATPSPDLDHTKWRLVEIHGGDLKAPTGKGPTLSFEKSQFGILACNSIGGGYRVEGSKLISTGPPRSTMKACLGDEQKFDTLLTRAVTGNKQFKIEGNRLTLQTNDGVELVFEKQPIASKAAKTRFIYVAPFTKDCVGVAPMKCLQVRESKDKPWTLHYSGITGFEHVPGIEYRLRIKEDKIARPAADQSSIVWYLDMIVEQSVVDREAADKYLGEKKIGNK